MQLLTCPSPGPLLQGTHVAPGELLLTNTMESLKGLDKAALLQQVCHQEQLPIQVEQGRLGKVAVASTVACIVQDEKGMCYGTLKYSCKCQLVGTCPSAVALPVPL